MNYLSKNLQLISTKRDVVNKPYIESTSQDYADNIIEKSFSIIKIPKNISDTISLLKSSYMSIDKKTKEAFSFESRSDGFMPLGITFARDKQKIDLCESFNYWFNYASDHKSYEVSKHDFYTGITQCEKYFSSTASSILKNLTIKLEYTHPLEFRNDSYVQFNSYHETLKQENRAYLQDTHEDGHIFTIVKPNAPGLVIYIGGSEYLVNLEKDEAIIWAGSLLTELTDGRIKPLYHAVLDFNLPSARTSLIYNVNALYESIPSMDGSLIKMKDIANSHHIEFGHQAYHS